MKYIVIAATNNKSFYLARQKIGGGYTTIATFTCEETAKKTAMILNDYEEARKAPKPMKFGAVA